MNRTFRFKRAITIDNTKVGPQIQKYAMLFTGTYAYLANQANGGELITGVDFAFFQDKDLAIPIPFEVVTHSTTTGAIRSYVQIPHMKEAIDTVVYLAYGSNAITTSAAYVAGSGVGQSPFDASYVAVWHLTGTNWLKDSSQSGAHTLSAPGNSPAQTTGPSGAADTGVLFTASNSECLSLGGNGVSPFKLNSGMSPYQVYVEAWIYSTAFHANAGLVAATNDTNKHWWVNTTATSGSSLVAQGSSSSESTVLCPSGSISDSAWHRLLATVGTTSALMLDGATVDSGAVTDLDDVGVISGNETYDVEIGKSFGSYGYFNGKISEVRVSNTFRGDSFINADWNNQNSPSTFYSIGNALDAGGGDTTGMKIEEGALL